jgi:hypothetical protein
MICEVAAIANMCLLKVVLRDDDDVAIKTTGAL